jgi:acyl-CoA thioester hydrolase
MHEHRTRRRVEFADTDMSGIAHFARFFVFMETAEHEFLNALGGTPGIYHDAEGRLIGWPRVAASCEFLSALRYGDEVEIRVRVLRKGRSSLTFGFELSRAATPVARGKFTTVCCVLDAPGGLEPIPIPPWIAEQIEEAVEPSAAPRS